MGKEKNTIVLDVDRIAEKTLEIFIEMGLEINMDSVETEKRLVESLVKDFMETEVEIIEKNLAATYVEQFVRDEL